MTFQSLTVYFKYPSQFTQLPSSPSDNQEITVPGKVHFLSYAKLSKEAELGAASP